MDVKWRVKIAVDISRGVMFGCPSYFGRIDEGKRVGGTIVELS